MEGIQIAAKQTNPDPDAPLEYRRGSYAVFTDRSRVDRESAFSMLRRTYWAKEMKRETFDRAVDRSLCFSLYDGPAMVGFGRVITDFATFGYLTDFVISEDRRGKGLGKWLVECVVSHPGLQGLRRLSLLTMDAMGLYGKAGFTAGSAHGTYMEKRGNGP